MIIKVTVTVGVTMIDDVDNDNNECFNSISVVVQFYPWFKFYFLCFGYGNLMIMSLKQR